MAKLTDAAIGAITTLADGDLEYTVDISDTTDDAAGSSKKITFANKRTQLRSDFAVHVTPQQYGALGDDAAGTMTAETTAIQAAADACAALNSPNITWPTLFLPRARGYRVNGTVTIAKNIHVLMDAPLRYGGTSQTTACLIIGETVNRNQEVDLRLRVERVTASDWSSEGSIGVLLYNTESSKITLSVSEFTIGAQLFGKGNGFVNNRVQLQRFVDNKFHLDLVNETDSITGWVNENVFIGGRIANTTSSHTGVARYGVRIRSADSTIKYNNDNLFLGLSFEIMKNEAGSADAIPFLISAGNEMEAMFCRNEGNDAIFARCSNDSSNSVFGHKHTVGTVEQLDNASGNVAIFTGGATGSGLSRAPLREVFDSGPMHDNAVYYDGTTIHVPNVFGVVSSTALEYVSRTNILFNVSETCTFTNATNVVDDTAHTRGNGDKLFFTTTGALPAELSTGTLYYVVTATANTFQVALTLGGAAVTFTDDGSATNTYHSPNRYLDMASSRGLGINVDTAVAKNFLVERDNDTTFGGRVRVRAYDADQVLLKGADDFTVDVANDEIDTVNHRLVVNDTITVATSAADLPEPLAVATTYYVTAVISDDSFQIALTEGGTAIVITDAGTPTHTWTLTRPHVVGSVNMPWSTTDFGGTYGMSSDNDGEVTLRIRDEVKHITLIVAGGSSNLRIRRLRVHTPDRASAPRTWVNYGPIRPGEPVATQAPTTGVYFGPRSIFDHTPVNSTPMGWVLSADGAPGTWLNMAEYGAIV